jgi:hypothetical protein
MFLLFQFFYLVFKLLLWCVLEIFAPRLQFLYFMFQNENHVTCIFSFLVPDEVHFFDLVFYLYTLLYDWSIDDVLFQNNDCVFIKLFEKVLEFSLLFFDAFGLCIGVLILIENLLLNSCGKWRFGVDKRFTVTCLWYVNMKRRTILVFIVSALPDIKFVNFGKWERHCAWSVHWWTAVGLHSEK